MAGPNIPFHPLADIFPLIQGKEFVALKADIKANGALIPIVMYEGKILDGRNRFRACQEVGVQPSFVDYAGDSPAHYVWSLNGPRRHMDSGQKAAVAVELLPYLEAEAKARQGTRTDIVEKIPPSETGKARDKAAEMVGTNPRYVSDAKRLKEENPEVFEQVKSGEKKLSQAKRETQKPAPDNRLAESLQQSRDLDNALREARREARKNSATPWREILDALFALNARISEAKKLPDCPPLLKKEALERWANISVFISTHLEHEQ